MEKYPLKEVLVNGVYEIDANGKSELLIADLKQLNKLAFQRMRLYFIFM
ncbi:hypothetical protein [Mucilaginibacter sp.]